MNFGRYKISLRIWHPTIPPEEITEELKMTPWRCWYAGQPRATPAGKPIAGMNKETYWTSDTLSEGNLPPNDLSVELSKLLDDLRPHRSFFHRIAQEGGRTEFFLGWFTPCNSGETLPHAVLAEMADLRIDLGLDVYCDPDTPAENPAPDKSEFV